MNTLRLYTSTHDSACPAPAAIGARAGASGNDPDDRLRAADAETFDSFSPAQIRLIRSVFGDDGGSSPHSVDLRTDIPLYFARFYLVFLLGRDRRSQTRRLENRRRRTAAFFGGLGLVAMTISPLVVLGLAAAYFAKSFLGIDLFADWHVPLFSTLLP